MTSKANLRFNTFNARGLGDRLKRKLIFGWLQEHQKGITLLQETHSTLKDEKLWCNEWGNKILFSHGTSQKGGVAILFSSDIQVDIKKCVTDEEGRVLLIDITVEDHDFILCNIYAPTKDKAREQQLFLNKLKDLLTPYIDRDLLIGGDYNICQFPEIDKKGGVKETQLPFAKEILSFKEEFQLEDSWRLRHPTLSRFTRREKTKGGYVQSRLDYWLTSKHLDYIIIKTDISPGRRSDHSVVSLTLELQNRDQRGRGFWKFNTNLLQDEVYLNQIKELIRHCNVKYKDTEDKRLVWDVIKCEIRAETISYACYKSKSRKQMEKELVKRLEELEILLAEDPSESVQAEHSVVTAELNSILSIKTKGAMLRSRSKWVEEGEKNTSYFLKLEKRNQKLKCITKLCTEGGQIITEQEDILQEEQAFYKRLYSKPKNDNPITDTESIFLDNPELSKLNNEDKDSLEQNITLEESRSALKELPNGKSPGSDGLPAEFYKIFWSEIGLMVLESYIYSFEKGELSIDQRRGIITLIPKQEKDLRHLNNWRPISLLNTDYKILAKVLANRLQGIIGNIINSDQSGYIKNRYIGDNIRTISDIIDYCKIYNKPGIICLIDFQKAFDSVSWSFLYKTLDALNFGENLQRWVKLLYNNTSSCVTNNGYSSAFFSVERGVRQGCPVSPLLFIIVAEMLSQKIRGDNSIKGIIVQETEFKISQLADDTTLFVGDTVSLNNVFILLDKFSLVSGLCLNRKKTQVLCMGMDGLALPQLGCRHIDESFKTLGIWFSADRELMDSLNFTACLDKLKCLLNIWKQRDLSLKGKVTILKTLAVPKLVYLSSLLFVPDWFVKRANKLFVDFIWDGKPSKVKLDTIIGEIADGGLKMPHVESVVKALKLSWLSRFYNDRIEGKWKVLSKEILGLTLDNILSKIDSRHLEDNLTPFYSQLLGIWYPLYITEPETESDILQEELFNNSFILIGKTPAKEGYDNWKQHNIRRIKDLINLEKGSFYYHTELSDIYSIPIDIMKYNSLISAIPSKWKLTIKHMATPIEVQNDPEDGIPKLLNRGHILPITSFRNCDFYKMLIKLIFRPPTAISRWCVLYPELETLDWADLFTLPYSTVRSTKHQAFQYKILNRIFACGSNLAIWRITEDNLCKECSVPDTLEHYFFDCHISYTFWKLLQTWFYKIVNVSIDLDALSILFGIVNSNNDNILFLLNYCILIGKWYIFKQKYLGKSFSFVEYLHELKAELEIEKYLLNLEGKSEVFLLKWNILYEEL